MSAWVLESAYKYAQAAAVLGRAGNFAGQSEVNAALAMELMLKSLLVQPVQNRRTGTVAEQYAMPRGIGIKDGHDLYQLYEAVPKDVADKVGLTSQQDLILRKRHVFKRARYPYEETAPGGYDNVLLGTVSWFLPQFVHHFIDIGRNDRWLAYIAQHPEKMTMAGLANPNR